MNESQNRIMDVILEEVEGSQTPPDLLEKITQAATKQSKSKQDSLAPVKQLHQTRTWQNRFGLVAAAACVVLGLALMVMSWEGEPEGITASPMARIEQHDDFVELHEGWVLVSDGALPVKVSEDTLKDVKGEVVAVAGDIPEENELTELQEWLEEQEVETEMITNPKHWVVASTMAFCLISGSATFNGETVYADKSEETDLSDLEMAEQVKIKLSKLAEKYEKESGTTIALETFAGLEISVALPSKDFSYNTLDMMRQLLATKSAGLVKNTKGLGLIAKPLAETEEHLQLLRGISAVGSMHDLEMAKVEFDCREVDGSKLRYALANLSTRRAGKLTLNSDNNTLTATDFVFNLKRMAKLIDCFMDSRAGNLANAATKAVVGDPSRGVRLKSKEVFTNGMFAQGYSISTKRPVIFAHENTAASPLSFVCPATERGSGVISFDSLLRNALSSSRFTLVRKGAFEEVVGLSVAMCSAPFVRCEDLGNVKEKEFALTFLRLKHAEATVLRSATANFMTRQGGVIVPVGGEPNCLILGDFGQNLRKIVKIVKGIDTPADAQHPSFSESNVTAKTYYPRNVADVEKRKYTISELAQNYATETGRNLITRNTSVMMQPVTFYQPAEGKRDWESMFRFALGTRRQALASNGDFDVIVAISEAMTKCKFATLDSVNKGNEHAFISTTVHMKYASASVVRSALANFSTRQGGNIVPITIAHRIEQRGPSQIPVRHSAIMLSDRRRNVIRMLRLIKHLDVKVPKRVLNKGEVLLDRSIFGVDDGPVATTQLEGNDLLKEYVKSTGRTVATADASITEKKHDVPTALTTAEKLRAALKYQRMALVEEGAYVRITPIHEAMTATPIVLDPNEVSNYQDHEFITTVMFLKHIEATKARGQAAKYVFSRGASVLPIPGVNAIVISDFAEGVRPMITALQQADVPE